MHHTSLNRKYKTPKNEQRGKRLNEIQSLWLKTQIVGRVLDRNEDTKEIMKMTQLKSLGQLKDKSLWRTTLIYFQQ